MSKRSIRLYVDDIQESISRIEAYTTTLTFEAFQEDKKTIDAVVRNLEIIGEAARNIPESIQSKHPDIPWHEIIGMRNKIIHEYFGIEKETLWKTIQDDLPQFKKRIEALVQLQQRAE